MERVFSAQGRHTRFRILFRPLLELALTVGIIVALFTLRGREVPDISWFIVSILGVRMIWETIGRKHIQRITILDDPQPAVQFECYFFFRGLKKTSVPVADLWFISEYAGRKREIISFTRKKRLFLELNSQKDHFDGETLNDMKAALAELVPHTVPT